MKKFDYILFYKNHYYILSTRDGLIVHRTVSFGTMYDFIKNKGLLFNRIRFKAINLDEFFRDWASFPDSRGSVKI